MAILLMVLEVVVVVVEAVATESRLAVSRSSVKVNKEDTENHLEGRRVAAVDSEEVVAVKVGVVDSVEVEEVKAVAVVSVVVVVEKVGVADSEAVAVEKVVDSVEVVVVVHRAIEVALTSVSNQNKTRRSRLTRDMR